MRCFGQRSRRYRAELAGSVAVLALCASAAQAQIANFALPSQPLSDSLMAVAKQTGDSILFSPQVLAGIKSPPLKGQMSAHSAVDALLKGTNLEVASVGSDVFVIRPASTPVLPPAPAQHGEVISPAHPQFAAATGPNIQLAQAATLDTASSASASVPGPKAEKTETVVVTGSLIARRDYATATPIVSVTPDALKDSGQTTLESGLAQLPQFSSATAGASPGEASLSLRGLGSQRNLVLLDGRRLLPSADNGTVDINQLPSGIIQSVEVITGGASATYGSDAVSGVVNFKTRQAFEGLEITSSFGTTQSYGGDSYDVNAVAGLNSPNDKGNLLLAAEYTKRIGVHQMDIPFSQQAINGVIPIIQGEYVGSSNSPSKAAINSYFAQFGAAANSVPNTGLIGFNSDGSLFAAGPPTVVNFETLTDSQGRRVNDINLGAVGNRSYFALAQTPLERWSIFSKGTYDFGGGLQAYGQALATNYSSTVPGDGSVTNARQLPTVPVTNPFIPAALKVLLASRPNPTAAFNIQKRFTDVGGYRTGTNANNIYQVVGGLSGVFGDNLTWDVHGSHGQTQTNYSLVGGVRVDLVQEMLNAADGGASMCVGGLNPFGDNTVSAACRQLLAPSIATRTAITQDELDASVQGSALTLPGGPVQFALGADYRSIGYKSVPDAELQDDVVFGNPPQAPAAGSTAVREGFGEVLIPALKDLPFVQLLNVDLAYRYSDYVLSGGTNTYKGDVDWRVTGGFRLRGGYERAIRAPAVSELFAAASGYITNRTPIINGVSDPCDVRGSLRNGSTAAQIVNLCEAQGLSPALIPTFQTSNNQMSSIASGNPNLRPEKADTFTGGVVYQPEIDSPWFGNASISLDYYNIRIRDAIAEIDGNSVINKCFNIDGSNPTFAATDYYCSLITRGVTGEVSALNTPNVNLGGYKTSGIDFQVDWTVDLSEVGFGSDAGGISANLNGSYLNDFKTQILPNTPYQENGGTTTTPLGPYPTWHTVSQFNYHNGDYSIGMRWRFIGGMEDSSIVTNPSSPILGPGTANYFDLILGYTLPTDTRLSLVVSNLLNRQPNQVGQNVGVTNASVYTLLGRTYLLTIDQKF